MRVIGCDPGKLSGICSFSIEEGEELPSCIEHYELNHLGVGQYFAHHLGTYQTVVALETFIITNQTAKNSAAPWSLETIGIVRYFCEMAHVPLFMQAPASAKRLIPDSVLKRAGLYWPGKPHAADSARHALYLAMTSHNLLQHLLKEDPNGSDNGEAGQGDR